MEALGANPTSAFHCCVDTGRAHIRASAVKLSFPTQFVGIEKGLFGSKTPSWHSVVVNFILIVVIPWLEPLGSQRCPKDQLYTIKYHVGDMWLRAACAEDNVTIT